ncbi:hypothetical protein [Streptomyces sp. NPDC048659]|uniref:hypothetical protein n=1 Tax=Streptomyces sp. NPDC048659 TaxID=3155489 RepID=UPI00343E15B4
MSAPGRARTGPDHARTDPALAELGPLAQVIARTLRDTPVRLGDPQAAPDLVGALTAAVAVYIRREVLPAGALDEAHPIETRWVVEARLRSDVWSPWSGPLTNPVEALAYCATAAESAVRREFRVVRRTTITTIEPMPPAADSETTT